MNYIAVRKDGQTDREGCQMRVERDVEQVLEKPWAFGSLALAVDVLSAIKSLLVSGLSLDRLGVHAV